MTLALALAPILISIASLALSLHAYRSSQPRWQLKASMAIVVGEDSHMSGLMVTVANTGRAPGVIQRVMLRTTDATFTAHHGGETSKLARGPKLPSTLAPTERHTWVFDYGRIRDELALQARETAPMLVAVIESGTSVVTSRERIKVGDLPSPPVPFGRFPGPIRPGLAWMRQKMRQFRPARPQLLGAVIVKGSEILHDRWTIGVQNFGTGTARNLRVDMIRVEGAVQRQEPSIKPRELPRLRGGQSYEFSFTFEEATRPTIPGVEYWWRLTVDGVHSGVRVGVTSREAAMEMVEQARQLMSTRPDDRRSI